MIIRLSWFEGFSWGGGLLLTLSQTRGFSLFQTEEFADDNFKFDENGGKFIKKVGNTLGKWEIARNEQFLLFPQFFRKTCTADT